jgi:4a-hydroxytetrahydrobiopterin dehydratase
MKTKLRDRQCKACKPGTPAFKTAQIAKLLSQLKGWKSTGAEISKTFDFPDYYHTMAFVNAVAWVANGQDHHPDLEVGYNRCKVRFSTHSVGGLSENDFISAARIDALLD